MVGRHGLGNSLGEKPHLDYFVLSVQFDNVRFDDLHKYWGRRCSFGTRVCTSRPIIKTIVLWNKGEVFAVPPRDFPGIYVRMPYCLVG